jgi:cyanophycin synthetase
MSSIVELRVLDGANIYFARPAVKLTLDASALTVLAEDEAAAVAGRIGLVGARPGLPGSEQRRRFAARTAAHVARSLAAGGGVRRLSVRARVGDDPAHVVVVFPWRRRGKAVALAEATGRVLDAIVEAEVVGVIDEQSREVAASPDGERPTVPRPRIPVVAVTGTNGKTTTSRLIAHLASCAGHRPGWSSTDGVYLDGELVDPGDWSGFGGAGQVLADRRTTLAVLETARGGILLRGIGATHNDVAVVTNVQADHLGMHGVHTLDQLAEVKAAIVRITRPTGWVVLNADDPRVIAMRRLTKARTFAFSLDPANPVLHEVLDEGGRAITVIDHQLAVVDSRDDADPLLPVIDVPMTLAGLSTFNTANALAGAAAGIAIGLPREAITEGLRTFTPDPTLNPGRMNLFECAGRVVVVDLAHNEDGLHALLEVAQGLRLPGASVRLAMGTAGDRTEELIRSLGEIGGRGSDQVVIANKAAYARGRSHDEMTALFRAGLADVGRTADEVYETELSGLEAIYAASAPGDVCALMCHAEREQVYAWLARQGAEAMTPEDVRARVVAATHP